MIDVIEKSCLTCKHKGKKTCAVYKSEGKHDPAMLWCGGWKEKK